MSIGCKLRHGVCISVRASSEARACLKGTHLSATLVVKSTQVQQPMDQQHPQLINQAVPVQQQTNV
jgi:hypothetical protein